MPFTVIQAGTALQLLDTNGNLTNLTLPPNVTLRADVPPRWAVYNDLVVLVNTPTTPITIDANGTVRVLTPTAPKTAPIISGGSAGALSGTYTVKYTFIIKDSVGTIISESDFSPASNTATISAQQLLVTGILTSTDNITARRLYRTTTNGTTYFPWLDLDGNTLTTVQDDLPDAALSIIAAPILGNPPRLIHIKEWRDRLWGVGDEALDDLRFTEASQPWSWPLDNEVSVPGAGRDQFGIRAVMPRREALGIGRRDLLWQITGETPDDFQAVKLSEILGVESNESVVIYRDTVWWLWKDGVYQWDDNGLVNVSDGKVKSWFSTDNYFNRDMFQFAFAVFDPVRLKYKLYLASAGSNKIDRWVEYDIQSSTWWGPHKTDAFSPTCAFLLGDAQDKVRAVAGSSSAFVWQEQTTPTDSSNTGISLDVISRWMDGNTPNYEKYWGQLFMLGKAQSAGSLTITPKVGYNNASSSPSFQYDMTQGRQRLPRIGTGKLAQLRFQHSQPGEPVELYGFELPYTIIGLR